MKIATLNSLITFQKNDVEVDKNANHKSVWTDFYTCHAEVSDANYSESQTAGQTTANNVINVDVRYCSELAPMVAANQGSKKYRIVFKDVAYNILSTDCNGYKNGHINIEARRDVE